MKHSPGTFFISLVLMLAVMAGTAQAEEAMKPFLLAETASGARADAAAEAKQKLEAAGFEVVGEYSPYENATIIAITNDALKQNAAKSEFGGFGAVLRVTATEVNGAVQVAYTNPTYLAHAYRMEGDLAEVTAALKQALGYETAYGPDKGLTPKELRKYHYKWLMPYFTNRLELASHSSHQAAVKAVEAALAEEKGGVSKVYRVEVPGGEETVFGVHMTTDCSGDEYIMSRIDFKDVKSTGHLPYEMVVRDNTVYTLPAEFRIAISFPDLSMMGRNSFASIMCAPDAIGEALTQAAGGEIESSGW